MLVDDRDGDKQALGDQSVTRPCARGSQKRMRANSSADNHDCGPAKLPRVSFLGRSVGSSTDPSTSTRLKSVHNDTLCENEAHLSEDCDSSSNHQPDDDDSDNEDDFDRPTAMFDLLLDLPPPPEDVDNVPSPSYSFQSSLLPAPTSLSSDFGSAQFMRRFNTRREYLQANSRLPGNLTSCEK